MEFKKIQLNGFKSFSEKTTFLIEKGLTGIVGPNGCGKSNIVESLRWCMGETSAKSMRGSGMEDVIFSGTSNKPSKNIAEVSINISNSEKSGSLQFKEVEEIEIRRKIERDRGSRFYLNDKEVRAKDAQMFFADLSTGAHSPSIISQGRIGSLVTAKPADRRAILEEAAGISGLHVRRHEAELRLNAAENNLKRADELRRQLEKQLASLEKQAEEATRYKKISDEIKQVEAGLYFLKIMEIENEIKVENEINTDAEKEFSLFNEKILDLENSIKKLEDELRPIRDNNLEIISRIQRLNLELQNLDEEAERMSTEIETTKISLKTIEEDVDREKSIVIDANSNQKRLNDENDKLVEIDSKYYETEKKSDQDLEVAKINLTNEQEKIDTLLNSLSAGKDVEHKNSLEDIRKILNETIDCIDNNQTQKARENLNNINVSLSYIIQKISDTDDNERIAKINSRNETIKKLQQEYTVTFSKNQSIKDESTKRKERINNINIEIESWKNLLVNSEKMIIQLGDRKEKLNKKLSDLEKQPNLNAEKKGQISENLRISENEKENNEIKINTLEQQLEENKTKLNEIKENSISVREKRASANATIVGLNKRKNDLTERVESELNIKEVNLLEFSNLEKEQDFPDTVTQEELLDKKRRDRDNLGSVNLRADEETGKYKNEITKMEKDREDIVTAITKLKDSINELNQKGRERLLDAFDKVSRKFNEVYTKLFNGGNAKLELVDSDDPLDAGLDLLVSPPGKRLQSITLLSGGEQALTALSLIFAVFLTNPAPICVLDEVDAPLDDANVTRFCNLLDELTRITTTKFIIVTHHALTMSKMDRLYGVTMPEKGISQLVSVDLQKAESLVA
jgi:chromosome segregation protein|tara:strand:- start:2402 stop:4975 length:2574 start_codon:yes stop_codon:yes gene_type:complete